MGIKILNFHSFGGFSENVNILGHGHFFQIFFGITSKFDYFYGVLLYELLVFIANSRIFGVSFKYPQTRYFWGTEQMLDRSLCMSKSSEYPLWISSFP